MKAILLAAGVGSRIAKDIDNIPKSMVRTGDKPLLLHTVELLKKEGIEPVVITGYKHRIIEEALKDHKVTLYYNPFYAVTNSIGSLWYARDEIEGDSVLIANADVYYTGELLDRILSAEYDNFLLSDKSRADKGDYFFLSENGVLKAFGKDLDRDHRNCEYVGIAMLKNAWVGRFRERLCKMIENGEYDLWWENVLYSFVGQEEIHTFDTEGIFWSEVDTIEDYDRVLEYIKRKDVK